jgi:FAD/FMN-containing dehydrogenase
VLGSLHSWSEAAVTSDIALNMQNFAEISLYTTADDGQVYVDVGAGCTVDRVLDYLQRAGYTLPVYGIVGQQTIGGAISTATHGSGRASMSHYVASVTVAAYDPDTGMPRVYEWREGDALRAARCSLGCAGVLLSARILVERDGYLEERGQWYERLDDLLREATDYPRYQFYLMPWSWKWYAQLRRPAPRPGMVATALGPLLRLFRLAVIDVLLHGAIRWLCAGPKSRRNIPWLFRRVVPLLAPAGISITDRSRELLMMRHDRYRHVECELFVPAAQLSKAAAYVEWVLRCSGGESRPLPDTCAALDLGRDMIAEMGVLRGAYTHDYVITFRRVLRDDTLISMTSGDTSDAWYAISLITYQRDIAPFLKVTGLLATTMRRAFGARPHWGKLCPLTTAEFATLYGDLDRFRAYCATVDPFQTFVNDFARRALGFGTQEPVHGSESRPRSDSPSTGTHLPS